MPIEVYSVDELEQDVIEAAIEYSQQARHGLYRDLAQHRNALFEAVDRLVMEHDGRWMPKDLHDRVDEHFRTLKMQCAEKGSLLEQWCDESLNDGLRAIARAQQLGGRS